MRAAAAGRAFRWLIFALHRLAGLVTYPGLLTKLRTYTLQMRIDPEHAHKSVQTPRQTC